MTREEAKRRLLDIERCTPIHTREDARDFEALEMAIQALSQEPCIYDLKNRYCPRLNERGFLVYPQDEGFTPLVMSKNPKDLNKFKQEVKQQPCDDAVSRDAVNTLVDELARAISDERCHIPQRGRDTGHIMHDILDLPSVTQKSGHWIETEYHRWRCSVCREKGMSEWDNIHDVRTNFCPNCGTKMENEERTE